MLTRSQLELLQDGTYWADVEAIALEDGTDAIDFDELPAPD